MRIVQDPLWLSALDCTELESPEPQEHFAVSQSAPTRKRMIDDKKTLSVTGLFAGIGGFEEGFRQAGHECSMLCEFDDSARNVLFGRFPQAEITTDVRALSDLRNCNVLTAGFPCQDLSQVGRTRGLSGPNSGLIDFVFKLLEEPTGAPEWVVLENVPFMLSLDKGNAIRTITTKLENLGFSWAYRTVNTQSFGLPQRRRRVILVASRDHDPRPVLFSDDAGARLPPPRASHACGFYWTEGNTGLGWAIDATPPLKGGSSIHIPSPPAVWFPRRRLIAMPTIEAAERLQGFDSNWTKTSSDDPRESRKRWRMVGNAVSVPVAKWIAERLQAPLAAFDDKCITQEQPPENKGWPSSAWGYKGARGLATVSEWPAAVQPSHLARFLKDDVVPLSRKATAGFLSRLVNSKLKYERAFREDLERHVRTCSSN